LDRVINDLIMQGDVINTEAKENDYFENLKHINNF